MDVEEWTWDAVEHQHRNETFLVLGDTGVGKSTIVNTLAGRVVADTGYSENGLPKTKAARSTLVVDRPFRGISARDTVAWDAKVLESLIRNVEEIQGNIVPIFVVEPRAGRLLQTDLTVICDICHYVRAEEDIGVIVAINKCEPRRPLGCSDLLHARFRREFPLIQLQTVRLDREPGDPCKLESQENVFRLGHAVSKAKGFRPRAD